MNIDDLEKMMAAGRDSALLRLSLARLLAKDGHWDKAADHLRSGLEQDPGYTAAWKELGRVCQAQGRRDEALAAWRKGIEVARAKGDKQAEKEMGVFLRREVKSQQGN